MEDLSRTGAVFDHSGLCVSRGEAMDEAALHRAAAAVFLLLRCRLLTQRSGGGSTAGAGSLAASLDPATTGAAPFLPKTRSSSSLNRPPIYEPGSAFGSSLGESTVNLNRAGYLPEHVTIETASETLHVLASATHITVFPLPPSTAAT